VQATSSAPAFIVNSLNAQVVAKKSPGRALQLDLSPSRQAQFGVG
jgi:hypothetical protein